MKKSQENLQFKIAIYMLHILFCGIGMILTNLGIWLLDE